MVHKCIHNSSIQNRQCWLHWYNITFPLHRMKQMCFKTYYMHSDRAGLMERNFNSIKTQMNPARKKNYKRHSVRALLKGALRTLSMSSAMSHRTIKWNAWKKYTTLKMKKKHTFRSQGKLNQIKKKTGIYQWPFSFYCWNCY